MELRRDADEALMPKRGRMARVARWAAPARLMMASQKSKTRLLHIADSAPFGQCGRFNHGKET